MTSGQSTWHNWSGVVQANPGSVQFPMSIQDVVQIVRTCRAEGRCLRVVGSGHSFTPLVATNDVLVSLDNMQGIVQVDAAAQTATVWAGTKLKMLGELLFAKGLAQENLGDIDVQSIAGAISTGTHGTGCKFGNISTQVIGVTVVTGRGEVLECSADAHPELFKALQVSLGALGVIVQVTLRLVPAFRMMSESRRVPLNECLEQLRTHADQHRHFEFYWFPYADPCQLKFMDETTLPATSHSVRDFFNETVVENGVLWTISELARKIPRLSSTVSRICAASVPVSSEIEYSHRLFATKRLVRFNEMEYNIPVDKMVPVIREMREAMEREKFAVHFPVECRFAQADDIWLSPAYGRDSAYIAVHMYRGMPFKRYFEVMEGIFLRYGGRPHWGKLHTLRAPQLSERYPEWSRFLAVRSALDPDGIFVNNYLRTLFGLEQAKQGTSESESRRVAE